MLSIDFCLFSSASHLKVYSLAPDLSGLLVNCKLNSKASSAVIVEVVGAGVADIGQFMFKPIFTNFI